MNYDCERPTSRVIQPPGGGSSNIFGGADSAELVTNRSKRRDIQHCAPATNEEAEKSQNKAKSVTKPLSSKETQLEDDSVGEGQEKAKKLIAESSKTSKTFESSVFESPDVTAKKEGYASPQYQSSIFPNQDKELQNDCEESNGSKKSEGINLKKFSNIPMFDCGKRPSTAPCFSTRGTGKTNRSSVFMHTDYPENPNFQPGVSRRPNTAYKPANANTKSSLFCKDQNAPINEIKESYRKPLSKKSTVFDPAPKQQIPTTPVSKTYRSTMNDVVAPAKFLHQKRSLKTFNGSNMNGSSCDVACDSPSPVIMSSDYCVSQLKENNVHHNTGPVPALERSNEFTLNRSPHNVITTSGQAVVHLKRLDNRKVSDNFKSEGFQASNGAARTQVSHEPAGLWSSDGRPSLSRSGSTRTSRSFQSQIFSSDKEPAVAPLWSSDFCRSPMLSEKKHVITNKSLSSSIFSPPEEPVGTPKRAVNKSFSSTIFMP